MHRLTGMLCAALLALPMRAAPATRSGPGLELPIKILTTADGLASDRVGRVFSDSHGFLWFGTEDGLSRFDGTRFVNFGTEQGLPYPVITDILEDHNGFYWIATNNGFAALDATAQANHPAGYQILKYSVSSDTAPNRVNTLFLDRSRKLWLGTDGGVFTLDHSHGVEFHRVPLSISVPDLLVQVWVLREDAEGSIWMGTKFGLVRRLPNGRMIRYPLRTDTATDHVMSLKIDRNGVLWVGHETGLLLFRPPPAAKADSPDSLDHSLESAVRAAAGFEIPAHEGEARFLPLGVAVRGLHQFADGRVWITTSFGGLFEFDGAHYRPVNANRRAIHDLSAGIAEDRDGNVWLGSQTSGAIRISPSGFVTYAQAEGLDKQLAGLVEFDNNHVMVLEGAMRIAWLYREDSGGETLLPKLITAPGGGGRQWGSTQSLLHDHLGDWWVATHDGIYRYAPPADAEHFLSGPPKAIYTARDGLAETWALRLYEDARGDIWIGSFAPSHEPLTRWERKTGRFIRYSDRDGLPAFSAATSFNEDREGYLWIGFREGGLGRYRDGKFRFFSSADGLPDGPISSCYLDHADRLWCASLQHGLLRMDTRGEHLDPVVYNARRGLSSDLVLGLGEDPHGRMLLGWAQGLDRLDPETNQVRHFTPADGLSPGRVVAVLPDRNGSIWLVTRTGISRLVGEPGGASATRAPTSTSPALISGVRVAGTSIPLSPLGVPSLSLGDLAPDKNSLEIDYLRISFAQGDPPRFQYKLDGADTQWTGPTALETVNYASLRSGSYRFQVRAVAPDGAPLSQPAVISLHILPPLWLRWWSIGAVLLILASSFVAFERYRTARIQEIGAALERSQVLTAALSDSEERFRTLAETASDAIITTNSDGVIVFVNSAAERIFGGSTSDMTGRSIAALIPGAWPHLGQREAWTGSSWKPIELPGIHPSSQELLLEVSFAAFEQEHRRYFTAVARDITERKRADEALRRLREDRLAELERVRRRIATDLHDDIGSSLTQISVLSEVVQQRVNDPGFSISAPLSYIARASSELIDSMSDIVWAINPQRDKLSDLLHRMRRFASDTFTARNIAFKMALPGDEQDVRLEGNLRRELFLIFKESVNNIVRHSGATAAEIELKLARRKLVLTIRDNGSGFDTGAPSAGHGLSSMRNRAGEIGAEYQLLSAIAGGTSIRVTVPVPA